MAYYVYKYVLGGECLYIGKTKQELKARINQHGKSGDNIPSEHWDEINKADIYFCELADGHMADIYEAELIRRHNPKFNKARKSNWSGIDLPEPVWNMYPRERLELKRVGRPSLRTKDEYETMKIRQSLQIMKELSKTMRDVGRTAEEIGIFQKDFLEKNGIAVPETFIFSGDEGSVNEYFKQFQQTGRYSLKDMYDGYLDWCSGNSRTPVIKRDFTDLIKDGAIQNVIFMTCARIGGISRRNVISVQPKSVLEHFFREKTEQVHGARLRRSELYESYIAFCSENELPADNKRDFYQNVRNHGIRQIKTKGYISFADIGVIDRKVT